MTALFGVDIKANVLAAFAGQLAAVTIHRATQTVDGYGTAAASFADHVAEGVRTSWDSRTLAARGYPMESVKIIVLQSAGVPEPRIGSDEITVSGVRYRIADVRADPVNATWTIAAVVV